MKYVGIDIGKDNFHLAVLSDEDQKKLNKAFRNHPEGYKEMYEWLEKKKVYLAESHLCMEATSIYYEALALSLHEAGWRVSVVNPLRIKAFAQSQLMRQKTDRADAETIARFCAQQSPAPWVPPMPEIRELQRLMARREAVQKMQGQERNRKSVTQGKALESVERLLVTLDGELKRLDEQIRDHIDRNPDLRNRQELLTSIPSVGDQLSANFMAWLPVERLDDVRDAVAFVGLSPCHRESGSSVRGKPQLSKLGHAHLRKLLYMPAMNALQYNPAAKRLAERLKQAGKPGKLIIGAIMRKLVHWMYGVLKSGRPFDVNLAIART